MERVFSAAQRRALVKMGGFTRVAARDLLSKRGKLIGRRKKGKKRTARESSPVNSPPYRIKGTLRKLVFWAYSHAKRSVVIGPTKFGKGIVPSLHERGGTQRLRSRRDGKFFTAKYGPRPYMRPAKKKAEADLDKAWENSVRG